MSVEVMNLKSQRADVWRITWWTALTAAIVAGLSLWVFWDGLSFMVSLWLNTPEYSHAILVPPIAAFLVWQQKDNLERLPFEGDWRGVVLVLLGGLLLVLGQFATIYVLVQYAYLLTLAGLVLSFTGVRAFRFLAMPLLILIFMIPLPISCSTTYPQNCSSYRHS